MTSYRTPSGQAAKRAARATIWSAINSVIPVLTSLGVFVVTARLLTPHDFGTVAFASGLALIGSAVCPGGLGEAIIQRLEISEQQLSSVFWLCLGSGTLVYTLECGAAASLGEYFHMHDLAALIPIISTRIIADMGAVVPNALLARAMSFHLIAMRTFFVSMIAAAITIGFLVAGFGIWALVFSQICSSYVIMAVGFVAIRWKPRVIFSAAAVKELLAYGLFSTGTQSLAKISLQNEQILVGLFLGTTQLGIYNFSKQILNVLNNVVANSLGAVAHPMFSGIQNDLERVKRGFLNATFISSLVAFPMFAGLALCAPKIVPVAFGLHWLPAVPLVQLQCSLGLLVCIGTLQSGLITSQGKANWWFYYQLAQTAGQVLAIVVFARFGVVIMLTAIVIKNYLLWFIPGRNSVRMMSMSLKEYAQNFRTPVIGTLCMSFAIFMTNTVLRDFSNIKTLIIDLALGILVYGASVFAIDANRIKLFLALFFLKFQTVIPREIEGIDK
jgi:O-antigen/teichoic acid export membrane protein